MEDMVGMKGDPEMATPTTDSSLSLPSTIGDESVGEVVEDKKDTRGSDSTTGTSGDPVGTCKGTTYKSGVQLRTDK